MKNSRLSLKGSTKSTKKMTLPFVDSPITVVLAVSGNEDESDGEDSCVNCNMLKVILSERRKLEKENFNHLKKQCLTNMHRLYRLGNLGRPRHVPNTSFQNTILSAFVRISSINYSCAGLTTCESRIRHGVWFCHITGPSSMVLITKL